jgi:hypothetical protein
VANTISIDADLTVTGITLSTGGTISEGVVTSNPTIQLTPATPDVASQKLVIKGGGTVDHHLHLTTGDLAETSIFLGTDDHNVRTTLNGNIEITTPNTVNNVWEFGTDGGLTFPDATVQTTAYTGSGTTLPAQTGNSGKYLTTDGTSASWGVSLRTNKTKLLNHTVAATTSGNANVTAWSASYTASGGAVEVTAQFTGYAPSSGSSVPYYLQRDGVTVDTATFYFNATNVHTLLPTLCYITSAETGAHTYSIRIGTGLTVDSGDTCLMVVTEY